MSPVSKAARLVPQVGEVTKARVNVIPRLASFIILGVRPLSRTQSGRDIRDRRRGK